MEQSKRAIDRNSLRRRVLKSAAVAGLLASLLTLTAIFYFRSSTAPPSHTGSAEALPNSIRQRLSRAPRRHRNLAEMPREEPDSNPEPIEDLEPEKSLLEIEGDTKFQRRLMLGEALIKIKNRAGTGPLTDEESKFMMPMNSTMVHDVALSTFWIMQKWDLDSWEKKPGELGALLLESMLHPPRNRCAFRLHPPSGGDPLGRGLLIRVWTRGERYPIGEIERAEANLRHILDVTGTDMPHGVDVLATPNLLLDLFPHPYHPRYTLEASGLYDSRENFCVVRSTSDPEWRSETLKHELIHAWTDRHTSRLAASSLIREGLAEYLRLLTGDDNGLVVPLERLADNLALLLSWLSDHRRRGLDIESFSPRELLNLSTEQFFRLAPTSYLVAQAAMAFIGSAVIERALRDEEPDILIEAAQGIVWEELLEFARRNAARGNQEAAIVVADTNPQPAVISAELSPAAKLVGEGSAGGAPGEGEFISRYYPVLSGSLASREFLQRVLDVQTDRKDAPVVLGIDPAFPRNRPFFISREAEGLGPIPLAAGRIATTGQFLEALWRSLEEDRAGFQGILLTEPAEPILTAVRLQASRDFTIEGFPVWAAGTVESRGHLVLCIGSRDEKARAEAARRAGKPGGESRETAAGGKDIERALLEHYRSRFDSVCRRFETALVIDLDPGRSDALLVAHALSSLPGFPGGVAVWSSNAAAESMAPSR